MPYSFARSLTASLFLDLVLVLNGVAGGEDASTSPQRIAPDPATGSSGAVVVGDVPLLYTGQILPAFPQNKAADAAPDLDAQLNSVFETLQELLKSERLGLEQTVKLNVYAASDNLAENVRRDLANRFRDLPVPAVSYVTGRLPDPKALVALDAVVAMNAAAAEQRRFPRAIAKNGLRRAPLAVQPAGPRVYISGQAEGAPDMAEATKKTMQSLEKTLKFLELELDDVVQIKSFLGPMTNVADARAEIEAFFNGRTVPPLVFVEWTSSLPIEIELIATSPRRERPQEPIEFVTPPGMTASPVFCRVTRVNAPETIFVSGLSGQEGAEPAQEVEQIFGTLRMLLLAAGSDLRHLAKATYYVSTDDASNRLNEIRPKLYDPRRPPAASKAMVSGTGMPRRTITIDMIAVRKPTTLGE